MTNKESLRAWIYRIMAQVEETPDDNLIAEMHKTGNVTELKILFKE